MNADVSQMIEIDADPAEVWEEVLRGEWLGDDAEIPARPGEEGQVADGNTVRVLITEEVDAPRRLVFRWASFEDEPSRVEIDIVEVGDRTAVIVTESPLVPITGTNAGTGTDDIAPTCSARRPALVGAR